MRPRIFPRMKISPTGFRAAITACVAALALILSSGCGSGEKNVQVVDYPGKDLHVEQIKAGSIFIYTLTSYDTTGAIIPGPNGLDTITISSIDTTVAGVTGLRALANGDHKGGTTYDRYEPNGDFSEIFFADTNHDGAAEMVGSLTYPILSKKSALLTTDTIYDASRNYEVRVDSMIYLGNEMLTTPAGPNRVFKSAHLQYRWSYTASGDLLFCKRDSDIYYFDTALGAFVKIIRESGKVDRNGVPLQPTGKAIYELVSYKFRYG